MSVRAVAATVTISLFFVGGCSLATTWNDLPLGPLESLDSGRTDAAKTVIDSGPVTADGGAEAGPDASTMSRCPPGGFVCGGSAEATDKDTLYQCDDTGKPIALTVCTHGCLQRQPSANDVCQCTVDGLYCGNDQIPGDPNTLYRCNPDFTGTLSMKCSTMCVVDKVGKDDKCE